jgi:integrase
MPKLKNRPPKLCKDKAYAIVYCNGTRLPMGKWGTREADQNYRRFLAEWAVASQSSITRPGKRIQVEEVIAAYLDWTENRIDPDSFRHACTVSQFVLNLYAGTPVDEFGPKALTAVQQDLAESGRFSRTHILRLISRVRTMFNWGVAQEIVPVTIADALKYVLPLKKGETIAHETKPREDVPDAVIEATLPYLSPVVAAMVQVQHWALMRPNEVCRMCVGDIDKKRKDGIWIYCPPEHKTVWRNDTRKVPLGKPEQVLIAPYLVGKTAEQAVFCTRRDEQYIPETYRGVITRAIVRANRSLPDDQKIPHWTPYQLRHTGITELVEENDGNLDIARATAGQKTISVTHGYNHADHNIAVKQAKKRSEKYDKEVRIQKSGDRR